MARQCRTVLLTAFAAVMASAAYAREEHLRLFAMHSCPITRALLCPTPPITPMPLGPFIRLECPAETDEATEGREIAIRWRSSPGVAQVRLYYYGTACRLGTKPRGSFDGFITQLVPNEGRAVWKVPWMDALAFRLRIAGFDQSGTRIAENERPVSYRPATMVDVDATCVVVDRTHQRLYYQRDGRIVRMHIVSTARRGYLTPPMEPGEHWRGVAVGKVFRKSVRAWSRAYQCPMPFWMAITSSGSHGIHAATPQAHRSLGRPASHGCVRQTLSDAKALFSLVTVGTAVYVY